MSRHHPLLNICQRKIDYKSREAADREIDRMRAMGRLTYLCRSYRCVFCEGVHIGKAKRGIRGGS